ncbi:MAG: hypothetical protein GWN39_12280, partial [Thermoplasmata archaeon]|nr:hypothetical protein [Thermoplasmata archaeon]NIT78134.1 hypothetical protein [Thermoplasmata archaeon]NIU49801.1 hypothetical protein [Thermoplasmata archaeon]NIV79492.1 hypothetical protein [Thermoplasmata archaeon]NIY04504.1 hypothetical protein [Thermoplasmata archaeon]
DTEPPILSIMYPVDGYITDAKNITIQGRTDVGANVTVEGVDVPVDDKGNWRRDVQLRMGTQAF